MADTKIVGGSGLARGCREREHKPGCECFVDHVTIGGSGSKKHPFKVITLPGSQPFVRATVTIFARTDGSDEKGDGSLDKPFLTLQEAVLHVPLILEPGVNYIIDITGIDETLPSDYTLPPWKSSWNTTFDPPPANPNIIFAAGVAIFAEPQLVSAIPPVEAVINPGDVASVTPDPITGLQTIILTAPRASWTNANLKGKQFTDGAEAFVNAVIYDVPNTSTISVASSAPITFPIRLVEPSAHLHGTPTNLGALNANNIDSLALNCLKITSDDPLKFGLVTDGGGTLVCQMCELVSPFIFNNEGGSGLGEQVRVVRSWIKGFPSFSNSVTLVQGLMDGTREMFPDGGSMPLFNAPVTASMRGMVFDGCDPVISAQIFPPGSDFNIPASTVHFTLRQSLVKNSTGDGVIFYGGSGLLLKCDLSSNPGNGVTAKLGSGVLNLQDVGSSSQNGNFGIEINDGMQVIADVDTTTTEPGAGRPLTGALGGNISLGSVGPVTWATVAAPPNNVPDFTGPSATGARISQQ